MENSVLVSLIFLEPERQSLYPFEKMEDFYKSHIKSGEISNDLQDFILYKDPTNEVFYRDFLDEGTKDQVDDFTKDLTVEFELAKYISIGEIITPSAFICSNDSASALRSFLDNQSICYLLEKKIWLKANSIQLFLIPVFCKKLNSFLYRYKWVRP